MPTRSRPRRASARDHAAQARELARARRQARQRRRIAITAAAAAVVALIATIVAILVTRSGSPARVAAGGSAGAGRLGLRQTPAPWDAGTPGLADRLARLALPSGGAGYHIHAHLAVYVQGRSIPVPADIGIDDQHGIESSLHTHDTTGVIHLEADRPSAKFTLGAVFDVWGVEFGPGRLGAYRDSAGNAVHAYVNGRAVADAAAYRLRPHDDVVVGYGSVSSFPHTVDFHWPAGE